MTKERELLKRWLIDFGKIHPDVELLKDTKELLAQPEQGQEPVAWIATGIGGGTAVGWYEKDIVNLPKGTKLYLHPPKREPISFEDLNTMWCGNPIDFARRIESIHGIGGGE